MVVGGGGSPSHPLMSEVQKLLGLSALDVISFNCKGMGHHKKRRRIATAFNRMDVLLLQETHGSQDCLGNFEKSFKDRSCFFSFGESNARGVGILIKKALLEKVTVDVTRDDDGRWIMVWLKGPDGPNALFVSVYAQNFKNTIRVKSERIKLLSEILSHVDRVKISEPHIPVLLAGDLNMPLDPILDAVRYPASYCRNHADELLEILTQRNLDDPFRTLYPDVKAYTFVANGSLTRRRLDYCFMSSELCGMLKSVSHEVSSLSDHLAVKVCLVTKDFEWKKVKNWRHDDDLLRRDDYCEAITSTISECESNEYDSHRAKWEFMKFKMRQTCRRMEKQFRDQDRAAEKEVNDKLARAEVVGSNEGIEQALLELRKFDEARLARLIRASNSLWTEANEKSTKFFYNRIKHNELNSNVITLKEGGQELDKAGTNNAVYQYYRELFQKRQLGPIAERWSNRLEDLPKITPELVEALRKPISGNELYRTTFKLLKCGKSPGNDGLTVKFYRTFWKRLYPYLTRSIRESVTEGELSPSQKQAIIRLIRKQEKDPGYIKNWRPISLINVDTKIFSRTLAERIKKCLPDLISQNQLAFIKGRNIAEGNRLLDYVIDDCESKGIQGLVANFDLAKAFDTVDHGYIRRVFSAYGFPAEFINMFDTLYRSAESAVMNNGRTTKYFPLERGCRQGDPSSPYVFILAFDPLIREINARADIRGLPTPAGEIKCSVFADDLTALIRSARDLDNVSESLRSFSEISGLCINNDKTEILRLEGTHLPQEYKNLEKDCLKVTGIYHSAGRNQTRCKEENFDKALAKLKNITNLWRQRNLSLLGRVQVLKAQGLTQFTHIANAIPIPQDILKKINKIVYKFLWGRPDRLKRKAVTLPISEGGLNFPIPEEVFKAASVKWIRSLQQSQHPWTSYLKRDAAVVGGLRNLQRNKISLRNLEMAKFSKYLFKAVQELEQEFPGNQEMSMAMGVWLNKTFRTRNGDSLPVGSLAARGFQTVADFHRPDGTMVSANQAVADGLPVRDVLEWSAVITAIRAAWGSTPNCAGNYTGVRAIENPNHFQLLAQEDTLATNGLTASRIIKFLQVNRAPVESAIPVNWLSKFNLDQDDARAARSLIWKVSIGTQLRTFHVRLISGLLYGNTDFLRFGYREHGACGWCGHLEQDNYHLLNDCPWTRALRSEMADKARELVLSDGKWIINDGPPEVCLLTVLFAQYLYRKNTHYERPTVAGFVGAIRELEVTELGIAIRRGLPRKHEQKWSKIRQILAKLEQRS